MPQIVDAGHLHTVRFWSRRTAHIVAISMAPNGWPQALFTVNLWAIGEAYEPVEHLKRYARHFQIEESRGDPRVIRFVNLVFRLFLLEIERLQEEKAAALAAFRVAHPGVTRSRIAPSRLPAGSRSTWRGSRPRA